MPNVIPKNLLTIYGRNPVLEALQDKSIPFFRIHLADSNKPSPPIKQMIDIAHARGIEIIHHDRMSLSRISKNRKQDQGVAADIVASNLQTADVFFDENKNFSLIALENITNPQNLGMIIRAASAGKIDGILVPRKGCAKMDALVIKASAGTLFKARIITCEDLHQALHQAKKQGTRIFGLALANSHPIQDTRIVRPNILLLGNETEGLSEATLRLCDELIHIPMENQVESLNVAVTAGILAFREIFSASL